MISFISHAMMLRHATVLMITFVIVIESAKGITGMNVSVQNADNKTT